MSHPVKALHNQQVNRSAPHFRVHTQRGGAAAGDVTYPKFAATSVVQLQNVALYKRVARWLPRNSYRVVFCGAVLRDDDRCQGNWVWVDVRRCSHIHTHTITAHPGSISQQQQQSKHQSGFELERREWK